MTNISFRLKKKEEYLETQSQGQVSEQRSGSYASTAKQDITPAEP